MIALWTGAFFLHKNGRFFWLAAAPAAFMTAVSTTYILSAKEGLQLSTAVSYPVGIIFAALCLGHFIYKTRTEHPDPEGERAKQRAAVPQVPADKPQGDGAAVADKNGQPANPAKDQPRVRI